MQDYHVLPSERITSFNIPKKNKKCGSEQVRRKKNRSSKNPQKLLAKVALQSFEESKIVGVKIRISTSRMVKLGCYQSRLLSPGGFFLVFGNLRKMRTGFVVVEKAIMKYQLGACFIEI